jgi:hypothetical protein
VNWKGCGRTWAWPGMGQEILRTLKNIRIVNVLAKIQNVHFQNISHKCCHWGQRTSIQKMKFGLFSWYGIWNPQMINSKFCKKSSPVNSEHKAGPSTDHAETMCGESRKLWLTIQSRVFCVTFREANFMDEPSTHLLVACLTGSNAAKQWQAQSPNNKISLSA